MRTNRNLWKPTTNALHQTKPNEQLESWQNQRKPTGTKRNRTITQQYKYKEAEMQLAAQNKTI